MSKSRELLLQKKNKKVISTLVETLSHAKYVSFCSGEILDVLRGKTALFCGYDKKPISTISVQEDYQKVGNWLKKCIRKTNISGCHALFCIGDTSTPFWVKLEFNSLEEVVVEIWKKSKSKELLVSDLNAVSLCMISNDEYYYSFYN